MSRRFQTKADRIVALERELSNWKNWHEQARLGGQTLAADRDKLKQELSEVKSELEQLKKRVEFVCVLTPTKSQV